MNLNRQKYLWPFIKGDEILFRLSVQYLLAAPIKITQ